MLVIFIFLDNLNELIEELKEYTEKAMKIEMNPWVQNYAVPMDELYTELTLEQIENKPTGPIPVKLESYAELFSENETTDQQQSHPDASSEPPRKRSRKIKGKKILAKGDPGMGKSTFGRKIAYDWAKGVFTAVSVVFFVSVKLIRPGQSIENIIIGQVPPLEALGIGESKLKIILNTIGDKCLIILDGLDELDLGSNEDVRKIIEGRKLLTCGVLLTSRPHDGDSIERYFPKHVSIKGFSRDHASQFVSKCIQNSQKANAVLGFSQRNFKSGVSSEVHFCPMILLFLRILVNSDELDLTREFIPFSEIYFKLVRCVYRRYCERIKIEFDENQFLDVLKRIGIMAWKMWKSGIGWAKQSEVLRTVGKDAFDIGLLIGHKDFRLTGNVTADILITFPHSSLQIFLGSFGFLQMLNDDQSVDSLLGVGNVGQRIVESPIFLRFCLWLLNGKNEYIKFSRRQAVLDSLSSQRAIQVNLVQLDIMDIGRLFPVLQVPYTCSEENVPVLDFIRGILSKCSKTTEFHLPLISLYPIDYLSKMIPDLPPHSQQRSIQLCTILERTSKAITLQNVLTGFDTSGVHPSVVLSCDVETDLSQILHRSMEQLSLSGTNRTSRVFSKLEIPLCPFLSELSLVNLRFGTPVLTTLATAMKCSKMPSLNRLSFEGCGASLRGNLHVLFTSTWSSLTHFNLNRCSLNSTDLETLRHCLSAEGNAQLPNMTSLVLYVNQVEGFVAILQESLQNIETLVLHDIDTDSYDSVVAVINAGKLPMLRDLTVSLAKVSDDTPDSSEDAIIAHLSIPTLNNLTLNRFISSPSHIRIVAASARNSKVTKLDISHSSGLTGMLSILVREDLSYLKSLVLSDCGLDSDDLISLAQAGGQDRLPELEYLDISNNVRVRGHLRQLFSFGQQWSHLLSLNVKQAAGVTPGNEFKELLNLARSGALVNLQQLTFSANDIDANLSNCMNVKWSSIKLLGVHCTHRHASSDHVQLYKELTELTQRDVFPNLNTLNVTSQIIPKHTVPIATGNASVSHLRQASIASVHLQDIIDVSSSQITTSRSKDESYLSYLSGLMNIKSAFDDILELPIEFFFTKCLSAISYHGADFAGTSSYLDITLASLQECMDSQDSPMNLSFVKSLLKAYFCNVKAYFNEEAVDLEPLSSKLQDWMDLSLEYPEIDISLLKALVEFGFRNLQFALNGQSLDLQPVCPLLRDWIAVSPSVPDIFRPLLKCAVDAVESVITGNQSGLQAASGEMHHWIENSSDFCTSERSFYRSLVDVFCAFLNCFFTSPLDLQSVRSLLNEYIDSGQDHFVRQYQIPMGKFVLKFMADLFCTFVECICNRPFNLKPVEELLNTWMGKMPNLLEAGPSINKSIAGILDSIVHLIVTRPLNVLGISPDPNLACVNSFESKDMQDYFLGMWSAQVTHQKNLKKLRDLKHRLRKLRIRVYEHYVPVEK